MKIKNYLFVLIFGLCLLLTGCGSAKTISISFDGDLTVGDKGTIAYSLEGVEGTITWISSDENIATVSNGEITAIGAGTCTITAKIDDLEASIEITVSAKASVTYKVKFYDDSFNVISEQDVEEGKDAVAPTIEDTEEKVFKAWSCDFTNVHSDLDVLATFKKKAVLSLNVNGGTLDGQAINYYYEGEDTILPSAHLAGSKFLGWEVSGKPGEYITKLNKNYKGEVNLTAKYSPISKVTTTIDFDGGISNDVYLANTSDALVSLSLTNYNANFGAYWGGGYANYVYITEKSNDPAATFSDRFYIGLDSETGMWKVVSVILSGASSWPSDAKYVITYSTGYSDYYSLHNTAGAKIEVGNYVVFDGDFTNIKKNGIASVNAYFFNTDPTNFSVEKTITLATDKLDTPSRLGYKFLGWVDAYDQDIENVSDLYEGVTLKAKWEERTPVTAISTNEIPTEMISADTFKITAKVVPSDAYFQQIYFETSDKDVISVDKNGNLSAKSAGTCTIKIYDYMNKAPIEKTITVYAPDSIDVNLGNSDGVLAVNETLQLTSKAYGKNREAITFTYESQTPSILEVSATGLVTAKAEGVGTISVKDSSGKNYTLEINVVVNNLDATERVDKLLKLIAENNISSVQAGNICLYNDGTERYYRPSYSSVNYFVFQEYTVDKTYLNSVANPDGSPKTRRYSGGFDDTIQFVTVHDTATLTGTAANTASGMRTSGTTGAATIHYATGQGKIYAAVDEKYIAYHAGDGTGTPFYWTKTNVLAPTSGDQTPTYTLIDVNNYKNIAINGQDTGIAIPAGIPEQHQRLTHLGPVWKVESDGYYYIGNTFYESSYGYIGCHGGNNNSIGIEMGVNYNDDTYLTWQITAQLVADICIRNGLDLTRVKQHNTWTGKNCPQSLIAGNYWYNFMKMVEVNYIVMKDYADATITMTPDNSGIIESNGRILNANAPTTTRTVSYTVTVEISGVKKSITLYNVVPGTTTWQQWEGSYLSSKIWNDGYLSKNDIINKPYN